MPFQPGVSGNPHGRPPKKRALTDTLEKWGGKTVVYNGKSISGRRLLARLAWQGLLTGTITFPDGTELRLGSTDWKDILKWLYSQIDGSPPTAMDITTRGESLNPEILSPSEIAARVAALKALDEPE